MTVIDELVTLLGIDISPGVAAKVEKFNATLGRVTKTVGWISAGLVAGASSILYFAERMNKGTAEMEKFVRLTGMNGDRMQAMSFAAEMVGGSFEGMQQDLMSLTKSMSSPIPGEFNHGLFMMGISVRNAKGELKGADQVLLDIADKMKGMDKATQLQWASKIGIGDDTLLLLQQGRHEIERLQQQARDIPTIVSPEQLKNAREFSVQLGLVRRIITYMGQEASAAAGPALKDMVNDFVKFLKHNREFIQTGIKNIIEGIVLGFKRFTSILRGLSDGAQAAFPWLKKLVGALSDTGTVSAIVFAAVAALAAVLVVLGAKFVLIAAAVMAVVLIIEDFITWLQGGSSATGELVKWVTALYEAFANRFPGIAAYLEKLAEVLGKVARVVGGAVVDAFKILWDVIAGLGKGLVWLLDKILMVIDKGLQLAGFGVKKEEGEEEDSEEPQSKVGSLSGSNSRKPRGPSSNKLFTDSMGDDYTRAMAFRSQAANFNKVPAGAGGNNSSTSQNTITIEQHISGDNAPAVASEAARKTSFALQQTFPGGLAPVAN